MAWCQEYDLGWTWLTECLGLWISHCMHPVIPMYDCGPTCTVDPLIKDVPVVVKFRLHNIQKWVSANTEQGSVIHVHLKLQPSMPLKTGELSNALFHIIKIQIKLNFNVPAADSFCVGNHPSK